jgi:hypothetical protein
MATVNTSWTSPASATLDKSTGGTIDEAMCDAIASDLYALGGTVGYIGCRAYASGALSVPNSTFTALALNTESFDTDPNGAMHDTSSNNSRITIRTAGVYHVSPYVEFATNATGFRQVAIRLNGATFLFGDHRAAVNGEATHVCYSHPYLFAANDYVEVLVAQNSGGALNVAAQVLSVVKA